MLKEEVQKLVINKISQALVAGGKLLFTAPQQKVSWKDQLTGQWSRSMGSQTYIDWLIEYNRQVENPMKMRVATTIIAHAKRTKLIGRNLVMKATAEP